MNELLKSNTVGSLREFNDVFCSDDRQPIHSATLCRIYPGIGQAYLATTWYWDSQETNAEQDYFSTQTILTTRPGMGMSGYDPYRNFLFNVEINPDYSLNSYRHLPDVSLLEKFPQTTAGFTTYDFCLNISGCSLRWWLPDIPDTRVVRHHPYGNVYSWDEEFNIWAGCATSSFNFSPAMSTYCSQSARNGSTYSVSRVKADVLDGWFTSHDGLPCLGPSGTNTLCHFGKVRWSGADIHV